MSQEKAQLIAPEGTFTVPGLNVAGVVTGGNFVGNVTGTASSVAKGANLIVGVLTASSFVGDVTGNVTGITSNTDNLILGEVTATSMVGDFTGIASGITGGPNIVAGLVTATKFQGDTTGSSTGVSGGKNINVGTFTASSFAGDLTGNAAGLSTTTANLKLGITSATSFAGDLTGNASELAGSSANLKLGITSASSFAGDLTGNAANLAGSSARLKLGIVTATSFAGNLTGNAANLTGTNANLNLGIVTASSFAGNLTGNVASLSTNDANMRLGIVTASSFAGNLLGNAGGIASNNKNLKLGICSATSFAGNLTGNASAVSGTPNLKLGICSASSFAGNLTGNASAVSGTPNLKLGICSASSFAGNLTGNASAVSGTPNLKLGICTASSFAGNLTGNAAGLTNNTSHANLGIVTASSGFSGDGSNLTGVASPAFDEQSVTAQSGTTTINLNSGNVIFLTHSNSTTIAFSNVPTAEIVTIVRTVDNANTITWPAAVAWDGVATPTLIENNSRDAAGQVFKLVTYNGGTNWYGYELVDANPTNTFGLFIWGGNDHGALGNSSPGPSKVSSPIQIGKEVTWSTLTGGFSFDSRGGIKNDGTLWMWGRNNHGQLGQNDLVSQSSPVQIPGTNWSNVSAGGDNEQSTVAIKTDGTMWAWGGNDVGNLGHNNRTDRSSPTQVPGTTWKDVSNGADWVLATKTDGTAWAWGKNSWGYLGLSNKQEKSSPTQIGTNDNWSYMVAGRPFNSMGVKTDGTFWTWGLGNNGALGQNNNTGYSSPRQIPGSWSNTHPTKLSAGFYRGMAIKTDGTLWAWGYQASGELGQNNNTNYSSPRQIPGTTWESVDNMYNVTLATKTDGTLWSWGYNNTGELGQNSTTKFSSPVQIPGSWKLGEDEIGRSIAAMKSNGLALKGI